MTAETWIYIGLTGILIGILAAIFPVYRRITWILATLRKRKISSPRLLTGLRNLILILLWIAIFSVILFGGFFFQAYHRFTLEEPVAKIMVEPVGDNQSSRITLQQLGVPDSQMVRVFLVQGDQWMLEGDILKWADWVNFLGLHTRYRLTRIRGRFQKTADEIRNLPTVYSLVENESHPLWNFLYEFAPRLPLVSSVYGNAVFQSSGKRKSFLVSVSTSGFVVRESQF